MMKSSILLDSLIKRIAAIAGNRRGHVVTAALSVMLAVVSVGCAATVGSTSEPSGAPTISPEPEVTASPSASPAVSPEAVEYPEFTVDLSDVPASVTIAANELADAWRTVAPKTGYKNCRAAELELVYANEDIDGSSVEVYQMDCQYQTESFAELIARMERDGDEAQLYADGWAAIDEPFYMVFRTYEGIYEFVGYAHKGDPGVPEPGTPEFDSFIAENSKCAMSAEIPVYFRKLLNGFKTELEDGHMNSVYYFLADFDGDAELELAVVSRIQIYLTEIYDYRDGEVVKVLDYDGSVYYDRNGTLWLTAGPYYEAMHRYIWNGESFEYTGESMGEVHELTYHFTDWDRPFYYLTLRGDESGEMNYEKVYEVSGWVGEEYEYLCDIDELEPYRITAEEYRAFRDSMYDENGEYRSFGYYDDTICGNISTFEENAIAEYNMQG